MLSQRNGLVRRTVIRTAALLAGVTITMALAAATSWADEKSDLDQCGTRTQMLEQAQQATAQRISAQELASLVGTEQAREWDIYLGLNANTGMEFSNPAGADVMWVPAGDAVDNADNRWVLATTSLISDDDLATLLTNRATTQVNVPAGENMGLKSGRQINRALDVDNCPDVPAECSGLDGSKASGRILDVDMAKEAAEEATAGPAEMLEVRKSEMLGKSGGNDDAADAKTAENAANDAAVNENGDDPENGDGFSGSDAAHDGEGPSGADDDERLIGLGDAANTDVGRDGNRELMRGQTRSEPSTLNKLSQPALTINQKSSKTDQATVDTRAAKSNDKPHGETLTAKPDQSACAETATVRPVFIAPAVDPTPDSDTVADADADADVNGDTDSVTNNAVPTDDGATAKPDVAATYEVLGVSAASSGGTAVNPVTAATVKPAADNLAYTGVTTNQLLILALALLAAGGSLITVTAAGPRRRREPAPRPGSAAM